MRCVRRLIQTKIHDYETRLIVIAALCGALLCSCGNRNKKAQKESVYKETIELTTVEGDHNLEATRIKLRIRW